MRTDYSGQLIDGRYRLEHLLGEGGMGAVYLGIQVRIKRKIAVKFLHRELASKPDLVKRFYREAQAATAIGHENIVDVIDVGVAPNGEPYLVMEYLEGESLAQLMKRKGPLDLGAACGILEPALRGLSAAHDTGIVHRDLKPDNIFLICKPNQDVRLKLIDFGISKFTEISNQSQLTQTGTMIGTPAYMAPEQVRGEKNVGTRADLYSIGVIFYEMLTGRYPFEGKHYNELLVKVLTSEPTLPSVAYAGFPKEAESLTMALLSRDPENRPGSADEVIESLKNLEGYADRQAQLDEAVSGLKQKSFAGGDLGAMLEPTEEHREHAAKILSDMTGDDTVSEWSRTAPAAPSKNRKLPLSVGAAVAALLIAAAVWLWSRTPPETEMTASAVPDVLSQAAAVSDPSTEEKEAPKPPEISLVKIEVLGVPSDGTIYYNNIAVPVGENPFLRTKEQTEVSLRVEAPGFKSYETLLLPDRDQQIRAQLVSDAHMGEQAVEPVRKEGEVRKKRRKRPEKKTDKSDEKNDAFHKAFKDFPDGEGGN